MSQWSSSCNKCLFKPFINFGVFIKIFNWYMAMMAGISSPCHSDWEGKGPCAIAVLSKYSGVLSDIGLTEF